MCSNDLFFGANKNQILKNGLWEQALTVLNKEDWQNIK